MLHVQTRTNKIKEKKFNKIWASLNHKVHAVFKQRT
jgi:hypothetical protein